MPTMRLHPHARERLGLHRTRDIIMTKTLEQFGTQAAFVMSIAFVMAIVLALF
jgi:hypothetical protein